MFTAAVIVLLIGWIAGKEARSAQEEGRTARGFGGLIETLVEWIRNDLMKPYMPPSMANLEKVYRDIHSRTIEMWAGCIWVPIYEVMVRKHLHVVTLEENLEMAADIGIEASTDLEGAFKAAMKRHGKDAKIVVLPYARYQLPRDAIRMPGEEKPVAMAAE